MEGDQGRPLPWPPSFVDQIKDHSLSFAAQRYSNEYPRSRTNFSLRLSGAGWKPIELFLAGLSFSFLCWPWFTYRRLFYYRLYSRSGRCFYAYLYT